jgi:hypothetical protein
VVGGGDLLSGDGPADGPFSVAFEGVLGQGDDGSLLFHLLGREKVSLCVEATFTLERCMFFA